MNKRAILNNSIIIMMLFVIIGLLFYGTYVLATIDSLTSSSPTNNAFTNDTTPDFQFTVIGNSSTYNCTLYIDDVANEVNESVIDNILTTITANPALSETNHSWYVNCTDAEGTNQTTPQTLTVDATLPEIDYDASTTASGNYSTTSVFINITCTDTNNDTTTLNWNGTNGPFNTTIGNVSSSTKSGLSGAYSFYAWCNDSAGNTNQTTTRNVFIDSTGPVISFTLPIVNSTYTNADTIYIDANISDTGIGLNASDGTPCNVYIDSDTASFTGTLIYNATSNNCTGTLTLGNPSNLSDGMHTLSVNFTDALENEGTGTVQIMVDNSAPVIGAVNITPQYDDGTVYITATSSISALITEGNSSIESCEYTLNNTDYVVATYNVSTGICSEMGVDTSSATLVNIRATNTAGLNNTGTAVNVTVDITPPITTIYSDNAGFNYVNDSENVTKYGGGESVDIPGYINDTLSGVKNWSLDIFVNNVFNSIACFNVSGESIINETLCNWNTTVFCSIGSECVNVSLVLNVIDNIGNQNNISDDINIIDSIIIDNKYPVINETAYHDFVKNGQDPGRWNVTFNVSDEHLRQVSTFILNSSNYIVVNEGFLCSMAQPNECNSPESGTFLQEWYTDSYSLNGSHVPVYYKFDFNASNDSQFNAIPGCLKLNNSANYDCGQEQDNCPSEENCTKAYRWWLVYNMSNETGTLIGLTQENWCPEGGAGCSINDSYTLSGAIPGEIAFIPQIDKYVGQEAFEKENLSEIITLYAIGDSSNLELVNDPIEGDYGLLVQAWDNVWISDSLWSDLFVIDTTAPRFDFDWWNTTIYENMTETPITLPDYKNFTSHADIFFSPNETNIHFSMNVSDSNGIESVYADLSEFDNFTKHGTCVGDQFNLSYNNLSGKWEGNCTLDLFNQTDILNYTGNGNESNGSNVAPFNVRFTAVDTYGNLANVYNTSTTPPQECVDYQGGGPEDTQCMPAQTLINLHDFGVPQLGGPGGQAPQGMECIEIGSSTTNFNTEFDFTNINFIMEIKVNMSCQANNSLLPQDFKTMMLWNFSSLDFNSPSTGAKLGMLMGAIDFVILPPNSYGSSRIYVNSSAFAELNRITTVTIYHLPFTTAPEIIADANAVGFNETSINWTSNGYEAEFYAVTGNLTFTVYGFSGYNISDNVSPIIIPIYPLEGQIINTSTININFSANGTGKPISRVMLILNETEESYNPDGQPPLYGITCNASQNGSELYYCNTTTSLSDGIYQANITAWDYGGETGNNATYLLNFSVDTTEPTLGITTSSNQLLGPSSWPLLLTGTVNDSSGLNTLRLFINNTFEDNITSTSGINWNYSWSPLDGLFSITVEACDLVDYCVNSTKTNISFDLTDPTTTTGTIPDTWNNTYTFNITLNATDAKSSIAFTSYKIGSLAWVNGSNVNGVSTIILNTSTNITSGNTTIYYYSVDNLGNKEDNQSFNVLFDNTAPVSSIIGYDADGINFTFNIWNINTALINLTGADSDSGYNNTLYCTNSSTCTPDLIWADTLNITNSGITYLRYRSVDNINNLEAMQTKKIMILYDNVSYINESNTVDENNTIIIVAVNSTDNGTIIVPPNINASLDLNELLNDTTNNVTLPVEINISSNTSNGLVLVLLPRHIIISGNSSWLGYFNLPRSSSNSVTIDADSGKTVDSSSIKVIELGADDIELLSNGTVRINFSGKAERYAGYFKNGEYYQIITKCTMNNLTWADTNLTTNGSCKITVGNDLIVLTKHFTQFVTYTQSTITSGGGSSSSSSGISGLVTSTSLSFGYQNLPAGTKIMYLSSTGIPIYQLSVTTNVALTNVVFKITKTDTPSATYNGRAYKYIQIDHVAVPDATINTVKILFKVEKSWLTNNSLEFKDLLFLRYVNGWTATTVKILSNDSTYVYYEAVSPGLSLFVIGAEGASYVEPIITPAPIIDPIPVTGDVVEEITTGTGVNDVKTISNASLARETSPITRFTIATLSLIALVTALYLLYTKRRNEM